MRYLLLLLLPAVAVGGELTTYCQTQYIDAYGRAQTICTTQLPINTDLEITDRYYERQRRIQESLDHSTRDYDDTRSDYPRWNDLNE